MTFSHKILVGLIAGVACGLFLGELVSPLGVMAEAFQTILIATEGQLRKGETDETPIRAAKAWQELTSGYGEDIDAYFKTFDANGYDEMIALIDIPFVSLCEHHLLPFTGFMREVVADFLHPLRELADRSHNLARSGHRRNPTTLPEICKLNS